MRLAIATVAAVFSAACADAHGPAPAHSSAPAQHVQPANIKRVGRDLPAGYEVATASKIAGPPATWGLGPGWTVDPPPCAGLADPAHGPGQSAQGISASGAGGIVYALVTAAPTGPAAPEPAVVAACPHWTMTAGRAAARVRLIEAPQIDGVPTLGMLTDTSTPVEGGNEIVSRAETFAAYLDGYYAFTTAVTDPGSPQPPLPPQAVAELLVKTVAALRG